MLQPVKSLDGILHFVPTIHRDARGGFHEWFKASEFENHTGYPFDLQQANISTSVRGTLRGLHFSEVPPGQAKFITCASGRIFDVAADVRLGSPTFGQWYSAELSEENREGLFVPSGFAHGFVAIEDSTVVYLTTSEYEPGVEHGINPFDAELDIAWPNLDYILSEKDQKAPNLKSIEGLLPLYDECISFQNSLRDSWVTANEEASW